jgi:hypothetical protein
MPTVVGAFLFLFAHAPAQTPELTIHLVGNAGVVVTDGTTSLLVDLPYESGAFGYAHYDPGSVQPAGTVVSVITHHHRDHFDPALFLARAHWRIIGPPNVTAELPAERVLGGDSVTVGAFAVIAVPSHHSPGHRSYRIRWRGRVLHFAGDTDDASTVPVEPHLDVLFVTPWLSCSFDWTRMVGPIQVVLYHQHPDGSGRVCGPAEALDRGEIVKLTPRAWLRRTRAPRTAVRRRSGCRMATRCASSRCSSDIRGSGCT